VKILVPIKRVADPANANKVKVSGATVTHDGLEWVMNPFDEWALETALRLTENAADKTRVGEIVIVSIGPKEAVETIREALGKGAERGILVEGSDAELDSHVVAQVLAKIVEKEKPDLVLMGKQATDMDSNQAGQRLAARLGWPQATFANKIALEGTSAVVSRETDSGEETLKLSLPAVVTADLRLNEPRYIALPGIIKARSKPLEKRTRATSETPLVTTVAYENPPQRAAGMRVNSTAELVAELKSRGAL